MSFLLLADKSSFGVLLGAAKSLECADPGGWVGFSTVAGYLWQGKPIVLIVFLPIALALYDELSVSRAAQTLGMSQPAVSMALRKLRTTFNDPLFVRAPRGITPPCPECQQGQYSICRNFARGVIPPGIHTGNSSAATGGFAPLVPAHESMCIPIPDGVRDDEAVLADPVSVSFHAVL